MKYYEIFARVNDRLSTFLTQHKWKKTFVQRSHYTLLISLLLLCTQNIHAQALKLTTDEQHWLNTHPIIRIAFDSDFPPFEWKNNSGIYQGLSVDNIRLIEKQLNIKFKRTQFNTWRQILTAFKTGKIDLLPAIAKNSTRQEYMLFTQPHFSSPGVIISSKKYHDIKELHGKRISVVNDFYWDDLISQFDKDFDIVRVENTQTGIELTAIGAVDAMVSDLASVTYIINKDGVSNLQVVPIPFNKKQDLKLAFGIRKDWPELQTILQKALNSISTEQKLTLENKWITLRKVSFWQAPEFGYAALFLFIFIGIIILWNWSLKSQVKRRSEQLANAQSQLIHAEKMESIGRLSAGVAHEVKNPLAIMQMCIDFLKGEKNSETVTSILDDMDDAVLRADTVIKGLLDFSREKELSFEEENINTILQQSIKLIQHELKQNSIQFHAHYGSEIPDIGMDINRLKQVFINLFINAVHAIKSSSRIKNREISLTTEICLLDTQLQWAFNTPKNKFYLGQKVLSITIRDNGSGLNNKDKDKIFDPFYTTKPLGEGTGLGLSVSKTIIGLHGGIIAMRNRIDSPSNKNLDTGVEIKILFTLQ